MSHSLWTVSSHSAANRAGLCLRGSAYGGRFALSASSCGSIKALAEWIRGHLFWTNIQGAELCAANICNISLDLTL